MDKKHEILQDIKRVASDIGKADITRSEYTASGKFTRHEIDSVFGGWTPARMAAGLDPVKQKSGKTVKKELKEKVNRFYTDGARSALKASMEIKSGIESGLSIKRYPKILVAPDIHAPWWNVDAVTAFVALAKEWQPDYLIQLGDFFDMWSYSKFPSSKLLIKADDELRQARQCFEWFWGTLKSVCPKAECHQLLGNHSLRPMKRVIESNCPELEVFLDFKSIFEYPGVITHHNPREPLVIDDIAFIHGWLSGRGKHREALAMNVVHGHTHELYLHWDRTRHNKLMFECSAGLLGDAGSKVMSYTAVKELKWQTGCVAIEHGPVLIPL